MLTSYFCVLVPRRLVAGTWFWRAFLQRSCETSGLLLQRKGCRWRDEIIAALRGRGRDERIEYSHGRHGCVLVPHNTPNEVPIRHTYQPEEELASVENVGVERARPFLRRAP